MKTINVSKLIDDAGLNRNMLAAVMFPEHKFPTYALDRIEKGLSLLDSQQMLVLADQLGVTLNDLYSEI